MKPALFAGTDNDRVVNDAGAEIFAATAALRTRTARIAVRNGSRRRPNFLQKKLQKPFADIGRRYETHAGLLFRINACDSFSRPTQQCKFISSTSSRLEIVDSGRVAG
jgi:hypothetical protein